MRPWVRKYRTKPCAARSYRDEIVAGIRRRGRAGGSGRFRLAVPKSLRHLGDRGIYPGRLERGIAPLLHGRSVDGEVPGAVRALAEVAIPDPSGLGRRHRGEAAEQCLQVEVRRWHGGPWTPAAFETHARTVAGQERAGRRIQEGEVMAGMTGGRQDLHRPPGDRELLAAVERVEPHRRDGGDRPPELVGGRPPGAPRAHDQPAGVHEMRYPGTVREQLRLRQQIGNSAEATGVVEMDMGH